MKESKREITERQLKNTLNWYLVMSTWEHTEKALRKTEKAKAILEGYIYGEIKLIKEEK